MIVLLSMKNRRSSRHAEHAYLFWGYFRLLHAPPFFGFESRHRSKRMISPAFHPHCSPHVSNVFPRFFHMFIHFPRFFPSGFPPGHLQVVDLLLSKGMSIEETDQSGWSPLVWATKQGPPGYPLKPWARYIQFPLVRKNHGWFDNV